MKKLIIAFAALALLGLACFEDEETPPPRDRVEPTTPANVLKNVAISFNQRGIKILDPVLGPNFVFHFDPRDVGHNPPGRQYVIPESWSHTEFCQAVNNMFDEAYSINLMISTSGVGTPGENETTYLAEYITLSLLVYIDELNGFIAEHGYCNFEFERYEAQSGKEYWRLINWWDHTGVYFDESTGVSPSTLGRVLAVFY